MKRFLLAACLLALSACPKRVSSVLSSDDEQLEADASRLEELHVRAQARAPSCSDWCQMSRTACELSGRACQIAKRHPDREDMQRRCAASQEDCAQMNDRCAACS